MNREPISTPRLVLVPVAPETAAAIVAGDLTGIAAGSGWPHADTLDGLRMGGGWLVTLDGVVIGDCGTHGARATTARSRSATASRSPTAAAATAPSW